MPRHFLVQRYNSLVSSTSPLSLEDDDDEENNQLLDLSLSSTAHSSASHRNQSKLPLSPVRFLPAEAHGKSRTLSAPIWHPAAPSPSTKRDNQLSSLPKPVITPMEFKYQSVAEGNPATLHLETGHPANTGASMSASSNTSCSSAWLSPTNSNTPALTSPIPAVDLRWFNINASLSSHSSSRIPTLSLLPGPGGLLVSPLALFGAKLPTVFPSYHRHHHTAAPLPFLLPTTTTVAEATVNPFHLHANDTPEAETEVEADGAAAQQDDMGLDLSLKPRDIRKQQSSPIPCQNISPPITHSKRSSIKSRRIDTPSPIPTSPMPSSTSLTAEKRLRSPLPEMPGTSGKKCKTAAAASPAVLAKKHRAVRKLAFDDETTSPVSGTIIRDAADFEEGVVFRQGDIDPAFNVVEVTEEARSEIAKIENKIGDYICRLCRVIFEDAFGLAQHRCPRIVNVEYRCPECDKVFNCPANLASHRRWHKPRPNSKKSKDLSVSGNTKSSVAGALTPSNSLNNNNRKQEDRTPKSQCNPCEERKETDGEILYRLMKESALANVAAVAAAAADSRDFPVSDLDGRPAVESFGSKGYPHRCHHCLEIFVTPHHLLRHVHIYHSSELKSSTSVTTSTGSSSSMLLQIPQVRAAT